MKKIFIGVVIGLIGALIITAFLFCHFWPRPGPDPEPVIVTVKEPVYISDISGQATIPEQPAGIYNPDFKVTVPVQGEFATENADIKVTGETIVERTNNLLKVDTIFHEAEVSIKYKPPPEPPKKLWSVGAYLVTDGDTIRPGGFIQRDFGLFEFWRVEAVAFGRVEVDCDTRIMAGVQVSF
jgi:hypothetical protein